MRLLTEEERQGTLAALDAQERELQRLILRVPLRVSMCECEGKTV